MTSPAKYVHACRQAKKNGHTRESPNQSRVAVESHPLAIHKESDMTQPIPFPQRTDTASTLTPPDGFCRQDTAPGALYRGEIAELHGLSIEHLWEPTRGTYYQINALDRPQLTREDLINIIGMLCGAFLWEAGR